MALDYDFGLVCQLMAIPAAAQAYFLVAPTPPAQVATVADADARGLQDFISRPLFLPSRRARPQPPPPAPSANERAAEPKPQAPEPVLTLLGVILAPHGREAIVRVDGGPAHVLVEGQTIGPWSLRQVLEDRALFATPHGELALAFSPHKPELPDNTLAAAPAKPPVLRRRP